MQPRERTVRELFQKHSNLTALTDVLTVEKMNYNQCFCQCLFFRRALKCMKWTLLAALDVSMSMADLLVEIYRSPCGKQAFKYIQLNNLLSHIK